jgi:putative membrane protein
MIYMVQLAAFVLALAVLSRPGIRFRIIPRPLKHDRAHATAMRQFWAQGLHKTENRTGVLIFASSAERYAEILADAGINQKVSPQVWDKAMADLIGAIKAGRPADGFVAAIEQCGAVLAEHFPLPRGSRNPDHIPDKLVEF